MNLLVRLLRVLIGSRFRRAVALMDETSIRFRVWPTDLDPLWHMNNGKYGSLMDLGRLDMMIRTGFWRAITARGWYPVVAAQTIRFKSSLTLFARFELRTRVLGWDDKSFYVYQAFVRGAEVAAVAVIRARFLTKGGKALTSAEIAEVVSPGQPSPELPDYVRQWRESETAFASSL